MPKIVRQNLYVHRQYAPGIVSPDTGLYHRVSCVPRDYDWTYVKWDRRTNALTFVQCVDWDAASEPTCGNMLRVPWDGPIVFLAIQSNPFIIHGKHLFVEPGYKGFDYEQARERWESYQGAEWLDKRLMGRRDWWAENALPRIGGG